MKVHVIPAADTSLPPAVRLDAETPADSVILGLLWQARPYEAGAASWTQDMVGMQHLVIAPVSPRVGDTGKREDLVKLSKETYTEPDVNNDRCGNCRYSTQDRFTELHCGISHKLAELREVNKHGKCKCWKAET